MRPRTDTAVVAQMQAMRAEGLTNRQIAELVGKSRDAVASLLYRRTPPTGPMMPSPDELECQIDALCAQVDPDAHFPEKWQPTKTAKAICARCTVTAECLAYALEHNERFGVWGGASERERRRMLAGAA